MQFTVPDAARKARAGGPPRAPYTDGGPDLAVILDLMMDLGLAAEEYLGGAGDEWEFGEPVTYQQQVDRHLIRESLKAVAATVRLSYDVLSGAVARELGAPGLARSDAPDAPVVVTADPRKSR